MDTDVSDEDWAGGEDWEYDDLFADAAGEIADVAQQCSGQPDGLHRAFRNTLNSVKLFTLSAFTKTASLEERSRTLSKVKSAVAESLGQQVGAQSDVQIMDRFTRRLKSDPEGSLNQRVISKIADCLSVRDDVLDNVSQPLKDLKPHSRANRFEPEEHDASITTLHNAFYTGALPCTCSDIDGAMRLSEKYVCALRLDGYNHVLGNNDYFFFDSVIASRDDNNHQWTPVQFQLPREPRERTRVRLSAESTDVEKASATRKALFRELDDFCKILKFNITCFRIHVNKDRKTHRFGWSKDNVFSNIFPPCGAPVLLSTALKHNELSARQKVFLAFAISKAFWQYYNSDWMHVEWSLETIQLLRTQSPESEAPFLKIEPVKSPDCRYQEHESQEGSDGIPHLHAYPFILNLGLLLVQLGSINTDKETITQNATHSTGTKRNNDICISCCTEVSAGDKWPRIRLPAKDKARYRRIVEECLPIPSETPRPLFKEHLDNLGRKLALKDFVVRPLFDLFQNMTDPDETVFQPPKVTLHKYPASQGEGSGTRMLKTQSDLASDWLNNITNSRLHCHVSLKIKGRKRPKIAIIDTGFDSGARFIDRKLKQRLGTFSATEQNYNWEDFWQPTGVPQDNDGHGTAMLSIVHRIAPFADVCVARIADKDEDLKKDPETTSNNLAKAIRWAVKEQGADIVSLSLGWEQEKRINEKNRAISNAISKALSRQNQNLLIFAAASNLGGSKHELFPAKHNTVFSIRATNTHGKHENFNPSLPKRNEKVFGTLGLDVPVCNRGKSTPQYVNKSGTSTATAIAAGIAAIAIAYVNIHDQQGSWDSVRTFDGFQKLLYKLSTEPEARKRFITLDNHLDLESFEKALNSASSSN